MDEKDDWRLLHDTVHLKKQYVNPINGNSILQKLPSLHHCIFCWDTVEKRIYDRWYLPIDQSCCICEDCFQDFRALFQWKLLDGWDLEL